MSASPNPPNVFSNPTTKEALVISGFARLAASDVLSGLEHDIGSPSILDVLISEFNSLPADQYGIGENRYRRHSRAVFLPWSKAIEWLPNRMAEGGESWTEYYQGRFHPDFLDNVRLFPAISETILTDPLVLKMIRNDFDLTSWNEFHVRQPMQLGLSLIKMKVEIGQGEAFSTPNSLHQDGETFTFAHLIERQNCIGGQNVIAGAEHAGKNPDELNSSQIRASFILEDPLDGYAVHDSAVSHYVAPIRPSDLNTPAVRSIMLIDFTPLITEHQIT